MALFGKFCIKRCSGHMDSMKHCTERILFIGVLQTAAPDSGVCLSMP
ncbi:MULTISPECIES: hypothetical protein [Anaerotruncus]|nr:MULTISPECIES: hypothetical protein [Anaerotruncus]MCI8494057.1 hypothetical protein [Anaerotruncus sp.]MCR2025027.1 hypothetical protein [Anaerotruncus colihominis]